MKTIDANQCTAIALGRIGENEYTLIRFDVSAWLEELPGAVIGLYNQRPGDNVAYPVAEINVDGGIAIWTVTSTELTKTGEGRCELVAIAGEVVAKSMIFRTMVFDALDGSGEAPEPWEEWQQQLIILKNEAEQAADRAEEAVEHYPRIADGVWEVWDAQAGVYVSTGVQALGVDGVSPTITVDTITGGHRIAITDANGTHTVDILDGAKGDTGRGIVSVQKTGTAGLVDTYTITYTDNTTSTFTVANGQNGAPGTDGATFTPAVSAEGVISWTNDGGKTNPQPVNIKGPQGDDGTSPTVSVADISGGHRVTVTDVNGTRSFDVMDGEDYVLTAADKAEIAQQAAGEVDVPTVATTSQVKAGTDSEHFLAPSVQDNAVYYALAKAAGADMKNLSGETVGVYPEAQKVAIQKMLGIYEPPWELIREDTFSNAEEANHIITVDGNGNSFELTDVRMLFEVPKVDAPATMGQYGQIWFYYTELGYIILEPGAFNRTATEAAKGCWYFVEYRDGMVFSSVGTGVTSSNSGAIKNRFSSYSNGAIANTSMGIMLYDDFRINKIEIRKITGTGHYKLYGKRKWN